MFAANSDAQTLSTTACRARTTLRKWYAAMSVASWRALDAIGSGRFSPNDPDRFRDLVDVVTYHDHFLVSADFDSYAANGATELFVDLNFDEEIGSPQADPMQSMRRAHEALEAFAPGG